MVVRGTHVYDLIINYSVQCYMWRQKGMHTLTGDCTNKPRMASIIRFVSVVNLLTCR